jgi:hypothetical protein
MAGLNAAAKNAAVDGLASPIVYVSLHTADPGSGSSASAGEATGGSPAYARKGVTYGSAASGVKVTAAAVTFDVPAGTYTHVGFYSASTGGTFYGSAALSASETFAAQGQYVLSSVTFTVN